MSKKLPPPPRSSSSASASAATAGAATYELQQAQSHASSQSDPIAWSSAKSYRRCPYRQLHHQNDTIGTFTVRLLEAQNLTRSHWSVLGMGPVRHLGLSRAHGEVSSYVELGLGWSSSSSSSGAKSADDAAGGSAGDAAPAAASATNGMQDPNCTYVDAWRRNSSSAAMAISEVNSRESEDNQEDQEDPEDDLDRKPAALPLDQLEQQQKPDLMSMSLRDAASQRMLQSVETEWNSGLGSRKKASSENEDEDSGKPPADDTCSTHVESMHDIGASNAHGSHAGESESESINRASHVHRSSTVHRNSNPTWPTAQRNGNRSLFAIRLHKRKHKTTNNGADGGVEDGGGGGTSSSNTDGQRIQLHIVVKEEMTGVENALPDPFGLGLTKGGGAGSRGGTIGWATVDVTDLALGGLLDAENEKENRRSEDGNVMSGGGASPSRGGVIDAWADLTLPIDDSHTGVARAAAASSPPDDSAQPIRPKHKCTGRVRVLISYEPHGMEPRRGDIAALECFARRNPSTSSCRILLPPLSPLRVLDVVGSYCLVEYDLPSSNVEALTTRDRKKQLAQNGHDDRQDQRNNRGGDNSSSRQTGRARIHRNSIFVIERTNAVDGAVNLALAPVDAYLSTPLGRTTSQIAGPLLDAAGELVAPAMLTGRLMLASANTVGAIGLNSAGAIVSTVAKSLDSKNEQALDDRDPLSKV